LFFHRRPLGSRLAVGGGPSLRATALHHLEHRARLTVRRHRVSSQVPSKLKANQALAAPLWSAAL
jgi:hypothetical protein